MNKPRVSIILPAHNAEEYLPRALESLFNQTEGSWEAICIDDASNDHSWDVLSAYAAKDPRIQAYRNDKCLWAGGSRNFGMDHSTGQYIMFCDSDDWYEPMMVETMLKTIDGEKCEIAQCYSIIETADMPVKEKINIPCLGYFNPEVKWGGMFRRPHRGLNTVCWNKIVRRDFLYAHHIRFSKNKRHEDDLFCAECIIAARRTKIVPVPLYHYRIHKGSMMQGERNMAESGFAWKSNIDEILKWGELNGFKRSRLLKKFVRKWETYE